MSQSKKICHFIFTILFQSEEDIGIAEQKFLRGINEDLKKKMLQDLSSEDDDDESDQSGTEDEEPPTVNEVEDPENENSNTSSILMDKFLDSLANNDDSDDEEDEVKKESRSKERNISTTKSDHNYSSYRSRKIDKRDRDLFNDKIFEDSDDEDVKSVGDPAQPSNQKEKSPKETKNTPPVTGDVDLTMFAAENAEKEKELAPEDFDFSSIAQKPIKEKEKEKAKIDNKADCISLSSDSDE
jgi:hypothetical protein